MLSAFARDDDGVEEESALVRVTLLCFATSVDGPVAPLRFQAEKSGTNKRPSPSPGGES